MPSKTHTAQKTPRTRTGKSASSAARRAKTPVNAPDANTVDDLQLAVMLVDPEFSITFANKSAVQLVAENLQHFRAEYPSIDPNELVGTRLDIFQKNPAERALLRDPAHLPHLAEVRVGQLYLKLAITGSHDP